MNLKCEEQLFSKSTLSSGNCGAFQTNQKNLQKKLENRSYTTSLTGGSQKCAFFIQSFNRENLKYAVKYKTSTNAALEEIAEIIKSK